MTQPSAPTPIFVTLSSAASRRLFAAIIVFWLFAAAGFYFATEAALARWAPAASNQAVGLIVTWVWIAQLLPLLKRTRSLTSGLLKGLGYAGGLGALMVAVLHYV